MHPLPVAVDLAEAFGVLLAADFITGIIHWAEDTWTSPGKNAFLDKWVVEDNIEHHRRPGTIRGGNYWLTNGPSLVFAAGVAAVLLVLHVHAWQAYLLVAIASQGNQVHKWAHSSERPWLVRRLQAIGLMQSRRHHGIHHSAPYAVHYCPLTDYLNPVLDGMNFWRTAERALVACGARVQRCTPARAGF